MFRMKLLASDPRQGKVSLATMVDLLFAYAASQGVEVAYQDIARATGVAWNNIRKIRLGENVNPSLHTIQAIADYFGVRLDYFNCNTEEECRAYLARLAAEDFASAPLRLRADGTSPEGVEARQALQAIIDYVKRVEGLLPPEPESSEPDTGPG